MYTGRGFVDSEYQIKYGNGDMQWGSRRMVSGANCRRQTQQTIIYMLCYIYIHAIHISPMTVLL